MPGGRVAGFGAFSASSITFIQLIGVAVIVAMITEAILVRVLLIPATMRLLSDASWRARGRCVTLYAVTASTKTRAPHPGAAACREAAQA